MEVKQIAWGVSPQAARLIYKHMEYTRVRAREEHVGNVPRSMRKDTWSPWEPWEETRNNKSTVGILTPKSCASTSGRTLSHLVTPGHKGSGGVM